MSPSFTHSTVAVGAAGGTADGSPPSRQPAVSATRTTSVARARQSIGTHTSLVSRTRTSVASSRTDRVSTSSATTPALVDLGDLVEDLLLELGQVVPRAVGSPPPSAFAPASARSPRVARRRRRSRSPSIACSYGRRAAPRARPRHPRPPPSPGASACPCRAPPHRRPPERAPARAGRASPRAGRGSSPSRHRRAPGPLRRAANSSDDSPGR